MNIRIEVRDGTFVSEEHQREKSLSQGIYNSKQGKKCWWKRFFKDEPRDDIMF
jgi:hypothetical protein